MKVYEIIKHFLNKPSKKLTKEETALLNENYWLKALWLKNDTNGINIENFDSMDQINPHVTLEYVYRTLIILEDEKENLTDIEYSILTDVLCYCEVAKGGTLAMRNKWKEKCFSLTIHNIGSAQIYADLMKNKINPDILNYITILISTHGLIGQYLRGETSLSSSEKLIGLSIPNVDHNKVIKVLNKCIIEGVSQKLYESIKEDVNSTIDELLNKNYNRLKKLRNTAIKNGEDFDTEYKDFLNKYPYCVKYLNDFLNRFNFWYVEVATSDFRLEETLKLFSYLGKVLERKPYTDITFENMMSFYCDYQGKKVINVFKERVVEKLLLDYDMQSNKPLENQHVSLVIEEDYPIIKLRMQFSEISEKFIDFCIAAIGKGALYDQIITMACDHFQIRRDKYDRFYNEYEYLQTMNSTTEQKKVLVDYITGDTIVDVGPGGGGLMDAILERFPEKNVIGIDISKNVVEKLQRIKTLYNKGWNVIQGNALDLGKTFKQGEFDNIIFCSILHELFSYVKFNDIKFNYETLRAVFSSVYHILPKGGRMLIRDGIMTEGNEYRIIQFKNPSDIEILKRYANDFNGRKIQYEIINETKVKMPINDAMEFLYTYTWGEESYAHEINEQFGYFTPKQYIDFVIKCFEGNCKVIYSKSFLQEGYTKHLIQKIDFIDPKTGKIAKLPDSTFILIIEKM